MTLNSYVTILGALVITVTLLSLLLPKGKTQKTVRTVLSLTVALSVLKPVIVLNGENLENIGDRFLSVQEDFIYFSDEYVIKLQQIACENIVNNYGIENCEVKIEYERSGDITEIKKVDVNLFDQVIISGEENIDIKEEITDAISAFLKVKREIVSINERKGE
ncbi:MAG: hypothetical protein J5697_01355 [Clostridia bacterium]|nr:hypothetical protein [Clostridia bacterium]